MIEFPSGTGSGTARRRPTGGSALSRMMRISICPIVAALTGGNIGQLADVSPAAAAAR